MGAVFFALRYTKADMTGFGKRVQEAREAAGLSQSDLARSVGVSPQAVQAIEAGRVQSSRKIREMAQVLGKTVDWLMGSSGDLETIPMSAGNQARVRGLVAAGLWQEDTTQGWDETPVPASPDKRFARLPQVAFRVVGNSMANRVRDGEYVLCIDYQEAPQPVRDGDVVVAERRRAGTFERTVKLVRQGRRGVELWPDSPDPAFKEPLRLDAPEDGTEVVIVGLVIGYYRPA